MNKLLHHVRKKVYDLIALARSKNIKPLPFVTVYVVTLLLFPFALAWVGKGVAEEATIYVLVPRILTAWLLLQAPSIYILLLGRDIAWYMLLPLVIIVLVVSTWYFKWIGLTIAAIFIISLYIIKNTQTKKETTHASDNRERTKRQS